MRIGDEESLDNIITQEPTHPRLDKITSSISYFPFQAVDLHDSSTNDLEEEDSVNRPTFENDGGHKEPKSIDAILRVDRCEWDFRVIFSSKMIPPMIDIDGC